MVFAPVSETSSRIGTICTAISVILLIHSLVAAIQYRHFVRAALVDGIQHTAALPFDVIFECLFSLAIGVYGISLLAGRFVPVFAAVSFAERPYDAVFYPSDISSFSQRTKAIAAIKQSN